MPDPATGHPFLSFTNTVTDDGKSRVVNSFDTGEELLRILRQAGLDAMGVTLPGRAHLATILNLREAGYAVLSAMAAGQKPGREDALLMEAAMKSTLQDASFSFGSTGLCLTAGPLGGLYESLILSFYDLMLRDDLHRLRECKRCSHLFLDHGRGRGRRWCSMSRCGNRAKAETFRTRHRAMGS